MILKRNFGRFSILISLLVTTSTFAQEDFKTESALSAGSIYKISVQAPGIHQIDRNFMAALPGLDLAQIDASNVRILGNQGGALPQTVAIDRIDDVEEVSMMAVGLHDGTFDQGDYLLFYAEGPDQWTLNAETGLFHMTKNIYGGANHYFLVVGEAAPVEIATAISESSAEASFSVFNYYQRLEQDRVNLLGKFRPPGSGKRWFGDEFSATTERTYSLDFPNIVANTEVAFRIEFAGRNGQSSSYFAELDGNMFSRTLSSVHLGDVESPYARIGILAGKYNSSAEQQQVKISYPFGTGATPGWLDYIELQAERNLNFTGPDMAFRNIESASVSLAEYTISGAPTSALIWDVTNPFEVVSRQFSRNGNSLTFRAATESTVREYIVFDANGQFPTPSFSEVVAAQNLHGIAETDVLIIYHPDFGEAAMKLADHRRAVSELDVTTVEIGQVFNEFSGGSPDPTAIREFARMLHQRSDRFNYLLLMGDGSYDMRHLNQDKPDDNFIPVYETGESMNPIRSFPSDDYYALLSMNEGRDLKGALDIAVGRLPVGTATEAESVVDKIIFYETNPKGLGDWRLRQVFIADDEDNNLHLSQSEDISRRVQANYDDLFNLNRLYLDAHEQVSTPGGPRYPTVNAQLNTFVEQGVLTVNYLGHGGSSGWSQERILQVADIQSWTNFDMLPLFVTATCSFTGYDEPSWTSAGEHVLLNPAGGAVALMTTVRAVYSSSNKRLTQAVFDRLFEQYDGKYLPIGEVMRLAKNSNSQDTIDINARKFALIGDPAMKLAIPEYNIALTSVNGVPVASGVADTVGALEQVSIAGEVLNEIGALNSSFSGILNVTVFDKPVTLKTLGNDIKSQVREFESQTRIIFKGSATVQNGEFNVEFIIPEDIDFSYGKGKISLYAHDGVQRDAAGAYHDLVIGGAKGGIATDEKGPDVVLFMDHEGFVDGDVTGPNPSLLVKLADKSGINVIGNSIGHDLVAVLDGEEWFILNNFYTSSIDDFTSGEVRFPLSALEEGKHEIVVTAWDVANNFSEAKITFVVGDDPKNVFRNVKASPNPSDGFTSFEFEHTISATTMDVFIDIYDSSGRHYVTIEKPNAVSSNQAISNVIWDVNDTGQVAPGMYFYRLRMVTPAGQMFESDLEKLVLLN